MLKFTPTGAQYIEFQITSLSAMFMIMTVFVIVLLHFTVRLLHNASLANLWFIALVLIEYSLIGVFMSNDLYSFFFFFELSLVPMFTVILLFGTGTNTKRAAYWLLFFTLISSVSLALATFIIKRSLGTVSFTNIYLVYTDIVQGDTPLAFFCFTLFLLAFLIKLPLYPLHVWLPEVHVEASTAGSMLLAGLMLKLGGYGIIRICYLCFPFIFEKASAFLTILALISTVSSAACALIQTDLKKIVAYSSIAHMSISLLGLLRPSEAGLAGCLLGWFAHAFTAPGLFFLVGLLYSRYKTRNILYYGGLSQFMPVFHFFWLLFILSNMSFPGTLNYVAEFYTIIGFIGAAPTLGFLTLMFFVLGLVLVSSYNLLMYVKVVYGPIITVNFKATTDLRLSETISLIM